MTIGKEQVLAIMPLQEAVFELTPETIALRRELHQHPELGFQEFNTSRIVAERLRALGLTVQTGIAGTGVIGLLTGSRPGKTVLLRADMDALPIEELNDVAYRSQVGGAMHACGHDGHTSGLLAVAKLLAGRRDEFAGTIKFCFQPCEESPPGGAKPMIEAGILEEPHVDAVFGLHLWQSLSVGTVGVLAGPAMANSDRFTIRIQGRGGHAAQPHLTVDATVVASQIVGALQTIIARNVSPLAAGVVTVGSLQAGTTYNVIADTAELKGTIRSFEAGLREALPARVEAIARGVAEALGATIEWEFLAGYPACVNDAALSELVRQAAAEVVGPAGVVTPEPTMGGEDFAYFLQARPGCFFFVGSRNEERGLTFGHHHPRFDIDEAALPIGIETLARVALRYLNS
jgi:amidohydrolase